MDLIIDGLKLMVLGMGTVISFLVMMVVIIRIMAKVLEPWKHLGTKAGPAPPRRVVDLAAADAAASAVDSDEDDIVAAICAAVNQFRNNGN